MAKQWLTWQKKEDNNGTRKTHIIIPRDICRVLAKERCCTALPFPFDVVKGMQLDHKYALIFVF